MQNEEQAQANMTAEGAPAAAPDEQALADGQAAIAAQEHGQVETGGKVKHTRIGGAPPPNIPVGDGVTTEQLAAARSKLYEQDAAFDARAKALAEELDTLQPADQSQNVRFRCGPADRRVGLVHFHADGNTTAQRLVPRQAYDIEVKPGEHLVIVHLADQGSNLRQFLRAAGIAPAAETGEPQ